MLARSSSKLPLQKIDTIAGVLYSAYEQERTTFVFGNGGSASLASHFACDLGKGTSAPGSDRKRFRVIALTDNIPSMTAWANDCSYDDIFAEQLRNLIRPGDIAFGISCSGNSPNVLSALRVGKEHAAITVGLGGFQGGKMAGLCDFSFIVPSDNMQIIEDLHLSVAHCIFTVVRNRIEVSEYKIAAVGAS